MYYHIVFGLMLSFYLTVNSQVINLHGNVRDQTGTPIPGATVILPHHELKDTTNTDGSFALTKSTATSLPVSKTITHTISINKGFLEFHLIHSSAIQIAVYSAQGRLLKKEFIKNAKTGLYRFNIADNCSADNLLIIHSSIGSHEMTFTYLPLQNATYAVTSIYNGVGSTIGKKNGAASFIDTLIITASGYISDAVALTSYDTTIDVTLNANSCILGNWRLERATCTTEGKDSCRVELQSCPSFYSFSDTHLTKYGSSMEVMCTIDGCDTTIYCYDTLTYEFHKVNESIYECWGDTIRISFKNDTLVFIREMLNGSPQGTKTYFFVRESQPVPYCSRECVESPFK